MAVIGCQEIKGVGCMRRDNKKRSKTIDKTQVVYTICFFALVMIDWVRGSQDGASWALAVNCTGFIMTVLMMMLMQSTGKEYAEKKPKVPYFIWIAVWVVGAGLGYILWNQNPGSIYQYQYISGALNVGCLGIVGIRIWLSRRELKIYKFWKSGSGEEWNRNEKLWKGILAASGVLMVFFMTLSPIGSIWQIWFLVMFGMFYLIPISREEGKKLWNGMADGIILGFFAIQIFAYGFRPYDEVRYKGAYSNCNVNALFYLVTYIMVLYRLHVQNSKERLEAGQKGKPGRFIKVFYYILAGGLISFIFFTIGRTALLVTVVVTFVYGIMTVIIAYKEKVSRLLLQWFMMGMCALVTFPCVYVTIRYLPGILHHPVWFEGEYSVSKVHSFDPVDSEKYVSLSEFWEAAVGRLNFQILSGRISGEMKMVAQAADPDISLPGEAYLVDARGEEDIGVIEQEVNEEDIDAIEKEVIEEDIGAIEQEVIDEKTEYILSGEDALNSGKIRKEIYLLYLKNLNFRGHILTDGYYQITPEYHAWHAQNVFLQITYYYGIPAGILFCFLILAAGWLGIKGFLRDPGRYENLSPVLVWLVFVGVGLLECVWNPGQLILTLLFLVQKIIIDNHCVDTKIVQPDET